MQNIAVHEASTLMRYISNAIGSIRDPQELFRTVTDKLRLVFEFDSAFIITLDRDRRFINVVFEMVRFDLPDTIQRKKRPVAGSWIESHLGDEGVSVVAIEGEMDRYPADFPVPRMLYDLGMRQVVLSPLRSGGKVIGFLNFVSREQKQWKESDKELLSTLSSPVAVALSSALAYEELRQREAQTAMQLAVNNALLTIKDRSRMLLAVCEQIDKLVPCTFLGIRVMDRDGNFRIFDNFMRETPSGFFPVSAHEKLDVPDFAEMARESFSLITSPGCFSGEAFQLLCDKYRLVGLVREKFNICSLISVRLWDLPGSCAGLIISDTSRAFDEHDQETVGLIVPQLSLALQNYLAFEEIDKLRRKLEGEKAYLFEEIKATHDFEEIKGESAVLASVLHRVSQVAPTDATVLIQGETGTGKELFARALHNLSRRRNRMLVKVNCAALPATLIESELFGHEKGSFTGAIERRIGKFELAEGGTVFLDEVGELPLELQAKLLRVLQERELERLGGRGVISVDVRVLAATNRNLEKEVAEGRFREDLFFRLNVFPLFVPPLRERREDIPLLALYFAAKFARLMGKPHCEFRESDMLLLKAREWKGNIRELAHLVEQAVIVSDGRWLDFSTMLSPSLAFTEPREQGQLKSMREFEEQVAMMERELILEVLSQSNGRVSGEGGAAEKLGMHPKTLYSRIEKLEIRKRYR
ncbi:sigma-54-dependent Fis family transcriptional regulator [Chlorobium phaeobacteroides]|uniref:DNA-binding protein Fis / transcriptional regulator, Fis family n=1 Tax=Chlorobium phaeobacteroides (strain DSM 266 / SMG 266 / 2430) TaxID=290317 RepID=A1BCP0_CHLPD|nr:sigma 54-interacting transcriptional regulator [Chlorobium phaeobacteroides]ABL64167.1 DNA-binding protein Fis / transcriptional regulator, Fis family [Chlorobium phaeobacteroides DSM 266]